jgi:hypothetical protein
MMVAFSIRLDRIDESLLYEAKDGSFWLSCVCTFEEDAKGRLIVAQSVPRERFAAGDRGPQVGHWREIGKPQPVQSKTAGFDLSKYKRVPQKTGPVPQGQDNQGDGPTPSDEGPAL